MEYLQLFDNNKNQIAGGKIARDHKLEVIPGERFMIVLIFIENKDHKFLIQKTPINKDGKFASTGGHVSFGDSSLKTILKETREELGIELTSGDVKFIDSVSTSKAFCDIYYTDKEMHRGDMTLQKSEVENVYWYSEAEIRNLIAHNEFRKRNIGPFEKVIAWRKENTPLLQKNMI
ncbi:MAG: NUDIX domain-containing protein [Butyrivibrio sp.]|nr:NUDIX domain-containing protein [Butyrivibrio sp.]